MSTGDVRLVVGDEPLTVADVIAVARQRQEVVLSERAARRMDSSATVVGRLSRSDVAIYGVTTGVGMLADTFIDESQRTDAQKAVIRSHAVGMGDPLADEVVRAAMLLRLQTLASGYTGARPDVARLIAAALNTGVTPWVPQHGSLGASGDLAPLAHVAIALLGEGWINRNGERVAAAEALRDNGIEPLQPAQKEGLSLINGTDFMAGIISLALHDTRRLLLLADCAAAMSIEALMGTTRAFEDDVIGLRKSAGVARSAKRLRSLLQGSAIVGSHRDSKHAVQDAYSLRCVPQVHGAAADVLDFVAGTVERELQSAVDNPVVVGEEVLSCGNFHGQALAYAADMLASVCADVASISERRIDRLLDPSRSRGLPPFLTSHPGPCSGLMMLQYPAAALVNRLRQLATPLAVQSASTSGGQEDHVSMGFEAALRTRDSVAGLRRVLTAELVCAAQALELRAPLRPAPGTSALLTAVRQHVPRLHEDRHIAGEVAALESWIGEAPLEKVVGNAVE